MITARVCLPLSHGTSFQSVLELVSEFQEILSMSQRTQV